MEEVSRQHQTPEQIVQNNRLRGFLRGDDNLDQLLYLLCLYIQDFVFPISPSADPEDLKQVLIRRLGQELRKAIIEKLRRYFPKDSNRGDDELLRYHPDRGRAILQQALSYLLDIWVPDKDGPEDTLVIKCQRILPLLSVLPDLRGKSALGTTSQLFGLVLYNDARTILQELPRAKQTLTEDDKCEREKFFFGVVAVLKSGETGLAPLPPSCLIDTFCAAAKIDFGDWMLLSRTEIALDIVAKVIGQTPDYFLHSVKELRERAQTLKRRPLKSSL